MAGRPRIEPVLPFERVDGEITPCQFWWENIPRIQLETDGNWWGNVVSDTSMGGDYYESSKEPVLADGKFLANKAALAERDCGYLVESGIATGISAVSRNTAGDRIETDLRVVERIVERRDAVSEGDYRDPILPDVQEFNIIQDVILGGPEDTIQDSIVGTVPDEIADQIIPE